MILTCRAKVSVGFIFSGSSSSIICFNYCLQEEKNKAAALKNAYVLLGRHQLELAIAFFLLGGDAASAVTVCARNLGDVQLALVICRLVEKHGGPLERNLVTKFILPSSIERGDYWLTSLLEVPEIISSSVSEFPLFFSSFSGL